MLIQASIEALRSRFDASGLTGAETIYASRNDNDIAFVAITADGSIATFKSDGYPEDLLEQEIMNLCCTKYDDRLIHIPCDIDDEKHVRETAGSISIILIELLVLFIVLVLAAIFLLIYWLLLGDLDKTLSIGVIICVPVIFFIFPRITARWKRGDK